MTFPVFASGDVLNASDMNAVGLWLVKSQTIGSAVSSVAVTNAFSADYEAYKITITGGSATGANVRLQLGASTASYYDTVLYIAASATTTPLAAGTNNGSIFARVGAADANGIRVDITILNPFLAKYTTFYGNYIFDTNAFGVAAGYHAVNTSYTDFTISPATGTLTGGEIRVYGYKK